MTDRLLREQLAELVRAEIERRAAERRVVARETAAGRLIIGGRAIGAMVGLAESTIYCLHAAHKIPTQKCGSRIVADRAALMRWASRRARRAALKSRDPRRRADAAQPR